MMQNSFSENGIMKQINYLQKEQAFIKKIVRPIKSSQQRDANKMKCRINF